MATILVSIMANIPTIMKSRNLTNSRLMTYGLSMSLRYASNDDPDI